MLCSPLALEIRDREGFEATSFSFGWKYIRLMQAAFAYPFAYL
jgi:hypothetical protein